MEPSPDCRVMRSLTVLAALGLQLMSLRTAVIRGCARGCRCSRSLSGLTCLRLLVVNSSNML